MTRSIDTITGITVETNGTLQVTDMRVDDFWASRRIADGRGAALDAVRDYRLAAYPIGGNGRPGVACLLAGANHRFDPRQPENHAARAIVTRYGEDIGIPIRGRAVILAGWESDPRRSWTPPHPAPLTNRRTYQVATRPDESLLARRKYQPVPSLAGTLLQEVEEASQEAQQCNDGARDRHDNHS